MALNPGSAMHSNGQFVWTKNIQAFFEQWMDVLHLNHCMKKGPEASCTCYEGAYRLAVKEIQNVERGKPDLHPAVAQTVWQRAFEIHKTDCSRRGHSNWRENIIAPLWSPSEKIVLGEICDCFDRALEEYDPSQATNPGPICEEEITVEEWMFERYV